MFHSHQHKQSGKNRVSPLFTRSLLLLLLLTSSNNPGLKITRNKKTALILLNCLRQLHCNHFVTIISPCQYLVIICNEHYTIIQSSCSCCGAFSMEHPGANKYNYNYCIKPVVSIEYKKTHLLYLAVKIYIMVMTHWVLPPWTPSSILNSKWQVKFICLYF